LIGTKGKRGDVFDKPIRLSSQDLCSWGLP
jgi:hypothetical protein